MARCHHSSATRRAGASAAQAGTPHTLLDAYTPHTPRSRKNRPSRHSSQFHLCMPGFCCSLSHHSRCSMLPPHAASQPHRTRSLPRREPQLRSTSSCLHPGALAHDPHRPTPTHVHTPHLPPQHLMSTWPPNRAARSASTPNTHIFTPRSP